MFGNSNRPYTDNKCFENLQLHNKNVEHVVVNNDNHGRIIICAAREYQALEYLQAIASNVSFGEKLFQSFDFDTR